MRQIIKGIKQIKYIWILIIFLVFFSNLFSQVHKVQHIYTTQGDFIYWNSHWSNQPVMLYSRDLKTNQEVPLFDTAKYLMTSWKTIKSTLSKSTYQQMFQQFEKQEKSTKNTNWNQLTHIEKKDQLTSMIRNKHPLIILLSYILPDFQKIIPHFWIQKQKELKPVRQYILCKENKTPKVCISSKTIHQSSLKPFSFRAKQITKITTSKNGIILHAKSYKRSSGIIAYNIYRRKKNQNNYIKINKLPIINLQEKDQKEISYLDNKTKPSISYQYKIEWIHFSNTRSHSLESHYILQTPNEENFILPITDLSISIKSNYTLLFNWKTTKEKNIIYHEIYRSSTKNGYYQKISKEKIPHQTNSVTLFLTKDLINKTFWYKIKSYSFKNHEFVFSNSIPKYHESIKIPDPPNLLTLIQKNKSILIKWSSPPKKESMKYHIYKKNLYTTQWTLIKSAVSQSFIYDTSVLKNGIYTYCIKSEDLFEKISKCSKESSILINSPPKILPPIKPYIIWGDDNIGHIYWKSTTQQSILFFEILIVKEQTNAKYLKKTNKPYYSFLFEKEKTYSIQVRVFHTNTEKSSFSPKLKVKSHPINKIPPVNMFSANPISSQKEFKQKNTKKCINTWKIKWDYFYTIDTVEFQLFKKENNSSSKILIDKVAFSKELRYEFIYKNKTCSKLDKFIIQVIGKNNQASMQKEIELSN